MARNGSGTMSLPYPSFTAGTTIQSGQVNSDLTDITNEISNSIAADGQTTPTANLKMGGFKLTGLGAATARTDAANLGNVQDSAVMWCGTAGGTADALTLSPTPSITAYSAGQVFRFKAGAASNATTTPTIAVSGLTAITVQNDGSALAAGDIAANKWFDVIYDGTNFQITRRRLGGSGTVTQIIAGTGLTGGTITSSGTVAVDVGTTASKIVQLDGSAKLPAVDGSALTGVPQLATTNLFTKANRNTPVALTSSSASIAIDLSASNYFSHTFTENTTLANPSNIVAGQAGQIAFTQHASSAKTLAFASYWIEATTGTAASVSTSTSAQNLLSYYVFDATHIYYVLNKHGVA